MPIRVPSVQGVMGGVGSYAIGAVAGIAQSFMSQYVGGLLGSAATAATAAAIVGGERGTIIATSAGYNLGLSGAIQQQFNLPGFNRGGPSSGNSILSF